MNKCDALWKCVRERGQARLILTFDEAEAIAGVPLDHSFLKYKRELLEYGYVQRKRLGRERREAEKQRRFDLRQGKTERKPQGTLRANQMGEVA